MAHHSNDDTCPISVIVPAWRRVKELLKTLRQIQQCCPAPAEILVHVDAATPAVLESLRQHHPELRVLTSEALLGPGGARNRLINESKYELVANFDDDSFPEQADYFARIMQTSALFPDAAMISAASQDFERQMPGFHVIAVSSGCGCVFRKSWFQRTRGFVSLPVAYGMEEVDISLQLHALGGKIIHDPGLHVKHDKLPPTEVSDDVNARVIANFALLPYLRYPCLFWPVGLWQVLRRCVYTVTHGWAAGTWKGLRMIPDHLRQHRQYKAHVSGAALLSWLRLRLSPQAVTPAHGPPLKH
ncbi:glycosyltransferase family 2 protein [Prosthecobacter sp.]